jgi:uncharacterized protein (TIGR00255 family)
MAESMTGYGRGEYRSERYHVGVEIKSVNHRFLEVKLRIPRELNASENAMRTALRRRFARGAVDATVQLERQEGSRRFAVDEQLLGQVADGLAAAARRLGIPGGFDLATLAQFREIFRFEAQPDDLAELEAGALVASGGVRQLEARGSAGRGARAAIAASCRSCGGCTDGCSSRRRRSPSR